jgi:hypothetical protein
LPGREFNGGTVADEPVLDCVLVRALASLQTADAALD